MSTQSSFKKMMLVDEAIVQRMKEKAILQYNPDLKVLVKLQESMNKALNGINLSNSERLQLYNTSLASDG